MLPTIMHMVTLHLISLKFFPSAQQFDPQADVFPYDNQMWEYKNSRNCLICLFLYSQGVKKLFTERDNNKSKLKKQTYLYSNWDSESLWSSLPWLQGDIFKGIFWSFLNPMSISNLCPPLLIQNQNFILYFRHMVLSLEMLF